MLVHRHSLGSLFQVRHTLMFQSMQCIHRLPTATAPIKYLDLGKREYTRYGRDVNEPLPHHSILCTLLLRQGSKTRQSRSSHQRTLPYRTKCLMCSTWCVNKSSGVQGHFKNFLQNSPMLCSAGRSPFLLPMEDIDALSFGSTAVEEPSITVISSMLSEFDLWSFVCYSNIGKRIDGRGRRFGRLKIASVGQYGKCSICSESRGELQVVEKSNSGRAVILCVPLFPFVVRNCCVNSGAFVSRQFKVRFQLVWNRVVQSKSVGERGSVATSNECSRWPRC